MSEYSTTWKRNELKAYILLYCANANYNESPEEVELIRAKVDKSRYQAIHAEFDEDNDYQSIQKIEAAIDRLDYAKSDINQLIVEMRELFNSDGHFDAAEKVLFLGLKKILKQDS